MFVLWMIYLLVLGGPEFMAHIKLYDSQEECESEKIRIWKETDQDKFLLPEEKDLYRFECRVRHGHAEENLRVSARSFDPMP